MPFINVEVTLKIFDSYSLKDKRRTIKSIINRTHNRYNVSIAEVKEQDMLNLAVLGIAVASSSKLVAQQMIDTIIKEMEAHYEVEIIDFQYHS